MPSVPSSGLAADIEERDFGPMILDGTTLDRSTAALNQEIREQYAHEAMVAQLHVPVVDQWRMTEVASASLPPSWPRGEPAETEFGIAVFDDTSLKESLIAFNLERATTSGDLFLQIAEAASASQREVNTDSFTLVAAMLSDRWSAEELRQEVERATTAFGIPVNDDQTLQGSLVALNDQIQEFEAQANVLTAQEPAPITDTSFDTYALAVSRTAEQGG
jgi:hypothetical protein